MPTLRVEGLGPGYDVVIRPGLIADPVPDDPEGASAFGDAAGRRAALISDETVFGLYGERLMGALRAAGASPRSIVVSPGESSKSHATLLFAYAEMTRMGLTRGDRIIALGGGVVGDLAGYAAATYLRGVPYIQVPTTLLAQADSSVGGKVAVDLPEGKNLVGAFYPPLRVLIDPDVLDTLPPRQLSAGMAEVIKHAALFDADLFSRLEGFSGAFPRGERASVIARNVAAKSDAVRRDPLDTGERMLLNFGHTLGHAVESAGGYALLHGEAVSVGMAAAARWGERMGITGRDAVRRLESLLRAFGLPLSAPETYPTRLLADIMGRDKKRAGSHITFAFIEEIGRGVLRAVPCAALTGDGGLLP